jgi:hypothetical protein
MKRLGDLRDLGGAESVRSQAAVRKTHAPAHDAVEGAEGLA